jgi:hypothetical protein
MISANCRQGISYYDLPCGDNDPFPSGCIVPHMVCAVGGPPACIDQQDNDFDGLTDYGSDPGCIDLFDLTETANCSDALDNDGDGLVDANDPGCVDGLDLDERSPTLVCDDGIDNDLDGLVDFIPAGAPPLYDYGDPGCQSPLSVSEKPQCQDGLDNDGDGAIDFDGGDSVDAHPRDGRIDAAFDFTTPLVGTADPQCAGQAYGNLEASPPVPVLPRRGDVALAVLLLASVIAALRTGVTRTFE